MYRIKVNARARNVSLRVTAEDGLVIVVPRGFDQRYIPSILNRKRAWLKRVAERLRLGRERLRGATHLPKSIVLQAVGEVWAIDYLSTAAKRISIRESAENRLLVVGNLKDEQLVKKALKKWIAKKALSSFLPWLESLSQASGFNFHKLVIRHQRTRWGSCSSKGTISLNLRLMFLPPQHVRYVLLHELAHTREMNHSRRFWSIVAAHEPEYKRCNAELRTAWRTIPAWLEV